MFNKALILLDAVKTAANQEEEMIMARENETLDVIEIGSVTSETKGPIGNGDDVQLARTPFGLFDD